MIDGTQGRVGALWEVETPAVYGKQACADGPAENQCRKQFERFTSYRKDARGARVDWSSLCRREQVDDASQAFPQPNWSVAQGSPKCSIPLTGD